MVPSLSMVGRRVARVALLVAFLLGGMQAARGLEVSGGNINTTNPTITPPYSLNGTSVAQPLPWNNVGQVNGASGVYLGDVDNNGMYWMITAYHVASSLPSTVTLSGTTYSTVAGSFSRLTNTGDNSNADIVMFRLNINANPANTTTLTLQSTTAAVNDELYMIGYGNGTNNSGPKRWGVSDVNATGYGSDGFGNMTYISTLYDPLSANANTARGITGDSGGGVFSYDAGTGFWELAGMMFANDPTHTYSADIATYRASIVAAAIPEPRNTLWLGLGVAALVTAGARWRRSRPAGHGVFTRS